MQWCLEGTCSWHSQELYKNCPRKY